MSILCTLDNDELNPWTTRHEVKHNILSVGDGGSINGIVNKDVKNLLTTKLA